MTNGFFLKISKDNDRFWLGINTKRYWVATHLDWTGSKPRSPVEGEKIVQYKWLPIAPEQLVWWGEE